MKKYIFYITSLLVLFITSCSDDEMKDSFGYLAVKISQDASSATTITKAADGFIASLYVIKLGTNDTVYRIAELAYPEMESQKFLPGSYRIAVRTISQRKFGFDMPVYAGEDTIQIVPQTIQTAKVVCTQANVKVSVSYSQKIKDNFTDYTTYVSQNTDTTAFSKGETRAAYFSPGDLDICISMTNNNGTVFEKVPIKTIMGAKAKEHYKITIDIDDSNPDATIDKGGASLSVKVDESTNNIECNYTVVLNNLPRPSLTCEGVELTTNEYKNWCGNIGVAEGSSVSSILKASTSYPIRTLAISSEFFKEKGLAEYIDLSTISPDTRTSLETLGFDLPFEAFGQKEAVFNFTAFTGKLPAGESGRAHLVKVIIGDDHNQETETHLTFIVQPNGSIHTEVANAWARFAYLNGSCIAESRPAFLFKYRKSGDENWITLDESLLTITEPQKNNFSFTTKITGLAPDTDYEYMACTETKEGTIIPFTTEKTIQVPNSNFDFWYTSGKHIYPNKDLSAGNFWWDSGNEGANTLTAKNPTSEEKTTVVKGSAAKLSSIDVLGNFAAGNVYTGDFGKATLSPLGATLDFGRPFTSRPSKLTGYYKYNPGTVNKGSYVLSSGDTDHCYIYIVLANWPDGPFHVDTGADKFLKFDDPSVLGYGELENAEAVSGDEPNGYRKFEIPVTYRDTKTKPTHILIVATASKYGDYFTGSTSSVLYIDELELVFDEE